MTQQHQPLVPLTDLDRAHLDYCVALALRELANRQARENRQKKAAEDRQQQAARDNAERGK